MTPSTPSKNHNGGNWIRWVILSLLMSAATVALISRTEKQEREIAMPVTFANLADNLLVTVASRHVVRLLVSDAPPPPKKSMDAEETACRADLSGLGEGTHSIPVDSSDIVLPRGVVLKTLLTQSLTVTVEKVTQKTVGVIVVLEGSPAPGFAVAAVSLKPDRILLKGTATMLAGINTVKTRPINLEDASESFKKEVPLNLPEAIAVDPPLRIVVAHVEVRERIVSRVLENIPVSVRGSSAGHQIHPDAITLTVSGPEAIVNAIETDPAFAVTVDLSDLPSGNHSLKAAIALPVKTTLVRVTPERFSVIISK